MHDRLVLLDTHAVFQLPYISLKFTYRYTQFHVYRHTKMQLTNHAAWLERIRAISHSHSVKGLALESCYSQQTTSN